PAAATLLALRTLCLTPSPCLTRRLRSTLGSGSVFRCLHRLLRRRLTRDRVPLRTVALVPPARHFSGQLAVAQAERQRKRQRHGSEEYGERDRHYVHRHTELLQRHEDGDDYSAAAPHPRQRRAALQGTRRCHDDSANELTEHYAHDHYHDRGNHARDERHELRENLRQRFQAHRICRQQQHGEHHEPECKVRNYASRIWMRAGPLDSLQYSAALEQGVELHSPEQALGATPHETREQVAGKEYYQRAEKRRYHRGEL